MDLADKVETLRQCLVQGATAPAAAGRDSIGAAVATADVLGVVLLDSAAVGVGGVGAYEMERVRGLGVEVVAVPLVTPESAPYLDPTLLSEALLSLV